MKKAIIALWSTMGLAILGFFISIFFVSSNVMLWKMFTVMVIVVMVTFWSAAILTAIYYVFPKKKEGEQTGEGYAGGSAANLDKH